MPCQHGNRWGNACSCSRLQVEVEFVHAEPVARQAGLDLTCFR